jgi:NitT/TauT family transport system substrate-binding protein
MIAGSAMSHFARAAVVGLLAIVTAPPACAENITFITDFGFNGRHAYYYVALERGYYRQAGLNVAFVRGNGSADAIRKGAAQIGLADAGSLVLARANDGVPVRMVAVVYAAPPHAIYASEDSSIRKPREVLFGAYAKAAGFDPSRVTWQVADSAALPALLATGRAEAVGQFTVGEPLLAAAVAPKKLVRLAYRDVGLDYYGNGIIASEDLIAKEPDIVHRFVAATLRGMADAFADPAMAGQTIGRYQQQIKPEIGAAEIEQVRAPAVDAGRQLGAIDPARMAATVRVIADAYALKKAASPEEMWTAGFVP